MIEGNLNVNMAQLETLKKALIAQKLSTIDEQTLLFNINLEIEKIKEIEKLLKTPVLFKAVYLGDAYLIDGVTYKNEYRVIEELGHRYVIINDSMSTSSLLKEKFIQIT